MKNLIKSTYLFCLFCCATTLTVAQTHLVKDINSLVDTSISVNITEFSELNQTTYFLASLPYNYPELWVTNGTSNGTHKATQINSGENVVHIISFDNSLIMAAATATSGIELWKTDGTQSGTVLLKDLSPGIGSGDPSNFHIVGSELFFTANFNNYSYELWKTDGTENGTTLVKEIPCTSGINAPDRHVDVNGQLYFLVENFLSGQSLWTSDGTESGTYQIENSSGEILLGASAPLVSNGLVYFTGSTSGIDCPLWVTDGTLSGTQQLTDFCVQSMKNHQDELYFLGADNTIGLSFWKTSGTSVSTELVLDPFPLDDEMIPVFNMDDNRLYFPALNSQSFLHSYNLISQELDTVQGVYIGQNVFETNDKLFVSGASSTLNHGLELGVLDGNSFSELNDIYTGTQSSEIQFHYLQDSLLYFSANNGFNGKELWALDTQSLLSWKVHEIGKTGIGSDIEKLYAYNDLLFFPATSNNEGREPWVSDGTQAGTYMIKDIVTGNQSSNPVNFIEFNNELYFFTMSSPRQLFKTDGTETGTTSITSVDFAQWIYPIATNDFIYFSGYDSDHGNELWKTDGTALGTELVKDIYPGPDDSGVFDFKLIGDLVFFKASDGLNGQKWWVTDGTESGTHMANTDDTESMYTAYIPSAEYNDQLLFSTLDNDEAYLFLSDGTSANASEIAHLIGYSDITRVVVNGDFAYWSVQALSGEHLLYRTDILTSEIDLIQTSNNGSLELYAIGDTIYFSANVYGMKWFGLTNASTEPFYVAPYRTFNAAEPIEFDNHLCYSGNYFGTHVPFVLKNGIMFPVAPPNSGINYTSYKTPLNNKLFFLANTYEYGSELWVYDKDNDTLPRESIIATSCTSYHCDQNNTDYLYSGIYCDTLQNNLGIDSVILQLELIVNYSIPHPISSAPFIEPTPESYCNGFLWLDGGTSNLYAEIDDNLFVTPQNNEQIVVGGLCHGIHTISLSDSCGYDYFSYFVIPYPNETIYHISGTEILDSLGYVAENCVIAYEQIDTAYISGISISDSIAYVEWTITDSLGNDYVENAIYNLLSGIGNYIFQISLYCPTKSTENVFAITQDAYAEAFISEENLSLITLYPNPTNDLVTISFNGTNAHCTIYDTQGKLIQTSTILSGGTISLRDVQTGVYFFELTTENGKTVKRVAKN